ncbi:hypothetical protein N425_05125 [Tannerella sp. oral taxon BU063 isolate Cell 2]|uniref:Uncharacterized protein n=1 Tax=Tannerella sp. oral taxon BU063 isolate Cell 2 TaxID=1411148 RepID=W2C766_9BACT|nr:hypothetical protein N425_05125 [Tannerella sp. oral taxon BU063 isolate Cell 2]
MQKERELKCSPVVISGANIQSISLFLRKGVSQALAGEVKADWGRGLDAGPGPTFSKDLF